MADVTISSLPLGTPSGSALLPFSQSGQTLAVSPSGVVAASPGSVLQIQSNNSDTVIGPITNSDSPLFSVSITPKFSTSKIYITSNFVWGSNNPNGGFALQRSINNGAFTNISKGSVSVVASEYGPARTIDGMFSLYDEILNNGAYPNNNWNTMTEVYSLLDSPNTTSNIVYRFYWYHLVQNGGTFYFNRQVSNTGGLWTFNRGSSTITAMEIAG